MKTENCKIKNYTFFVLTVIFAFIFISAKNASALTGSILAGSQALVCKDAVCKNPPPDMIDFDKGESPLVIDSEKGLSGTAFGNELGSIVFNLPEEEGGGVYFADSKTGLLAGYAKSESGYINFAVTGQKVVIDPKNGEWKGYAWATGEKGGWVKFDCQDELACVRTIWNSSANSGTSATTIREENTENWIEKIMERTENFYIALGSNLISLVEKTGQMVGNVFSSAVAVLVGVFPQDSPMVLDTFPQKQMTAQVESGAESSANISDFNAWVKEKTSDLLGKIAK